MDAVADPRPIMPWLQTAVLVVAILETLAALTSLPALFGDLSEITGRGPGGWAIAATIVLHPVFAVAALVFYVRGRIDRAIMALAGAAIFAWLRLLPSIVSHGFDYSGSPIAALHMLLRTIVFPVLAVAAIAWAWRRERLSQAALFVCLPTAIDVLGTLAFGVGVAIYGF